MRLPPPTEDFKGPEATQEQEDDMMEEEIGMEPSAEFTYEEVKEVSEELEMQERAVDEEITAETVDEVELEYDEETLGTNESEESPVEEEVTTTGEKADQTTEEGTLVEEDIIVETVLDGYDDVEVEEEVIYPDAAEQDNYDHSDDEGVVFDMDAKTPISTNKRRGRDSFVSEFLQKVPDTPISLESPDPDNQKKSLVARPSPTVEQSSSVEMPKPDGPRHVALADMEDLGITFGPSQSKSLKQVTFLGLPANPPELTTESTENGAIRENDDDGSSSSSYETDSSDDEYETDSSPENQMSAERFPSIVKRKSSQDSTDNDLLNNIIPIRMAATDSLDVPKQIQDDSDSQEDSEEDIEEDSEDEDEEDEEPPKKDNKWFICVVIVLAFLLLLVTALSLYVFYELSEQGARPPVRAVPSQSTLPSFSPSSLARPTQAPSSFAPQSPTISSAPSPIEPSTMAPTMFNDLCVHAIGPLNPGANITGTIENAGVDEVDQCGEAINTDPGVWYYVYGTGGEMMAHTCADTEFDSKLSIFQGSCSQLQCLEINDNFCGKQSAVSWESQFNKPYLILVHGSVALRGTGESFQLSIESRYNDECNTAIGLELTSNTSGPVVTGQTFDANPNPIVCNGLANDSPSVFYRVQGTGSDIIAVLREGTDFNAQISVLTGRCLNLQCLGQSQVGDRELRWSSVESQTYYVIIHGESADDVGNFALQIRGATSQERASW